MARFTGGRRLALVVLLAIISAGLTAVLPARPALAYDARHTSLVTANPADWTPNVVDSTGSVRSLAQTGTTMLAGGKFTQVQNAGGGATLTRTNVFAFNATTGAVSTSFAPSLDGMVRAVLPASNGTTAYLGGEFKNVNGVPKVSLVSLNLSNGSINPTFQVPVLDGRVYSMALANGRLYISGTFKHVGTRSIAYVAALDPVTGAVDTAFTLSISGLINPNPQQGWSTRVLKLDVSPDGTRMAIVGDFTTVNGQSRPQIALLDISGPTPKVADWQTNLFSIMCHSNWESYVMDVAFAPDGAYFAVAAGGGYDGNTSKGCDSSSRFDTAATGTNIQPTWIDHTGGDTLWTVAVTGKAVYTGGHNRWQNNPYGGDFAGPGSVSRPGLGALDPRTGVPFDWNPGRTLGVGVFDLLATSAGLWIGNDTNMVGGENHSKLAFFPTAGGKTVPRPSAGTLPGTVVQLGRSGANSRSVGTCGAASTGSDDTASKRSFDGTTAGPLTTLSPQNTAWGQAQGSFMLSGVLYTGWDDGTLCRRSFDGTTFGSAQQVDLHDNVFADDLESVTAMFFSNNRIYYTKVGSSTLFYRYFLPQSDLVGSVWFGASAEVNGIDFSKISGMFLAGSKLYFVTRTDGVLRRIDWNGQAPVPGTMVAVSGPGVDGAPTWSSRALTLYAGAGAVAANIAPRAVITPTCSSATCSFSSAGSYDDDGSVTAYSWNFGDGSTSTAASPTHTYAASGTYSVTLTVTDDLGGTGATVRSVPVTKLGSNGISYLGESDVNTNSTSWTVQVPNSVVPGDGLILTASSNSISASLTPPAGWSLVGSQTASSVITRVWQRVATASDPGSSVTLSGSGLMKVNAVLLAYRGTSTSGPVGNIVAASETTTRSTHTTPSATATTTGSWVLSLWADKSSATTAITPPGGQRQRFTGCGTGGGHICSLVTDSGPVNAGSPVGGLTATANSASNADTMWTIVLTP